MKNITFSLTLAFCSIAAFAQDVTTIAILPASPTTTDNVQIVVTVTFPGGPCSYESQYPMVISNDTVIFNTLYCYQSDAGGCTTVDTFTIGTLPAGPHTIRFLMSSTNTGAACGSQIMNLKDIGLQNFTVTTGTTGITQVNTARVQLSPNPITDRINFTFDNNKSETVEITLLDISGKTMKAATFTSGEQLTLNVAELPANIYFYTLKTATQSASGKLVKE